MFNFDYEKGIDLILDRYKTTFLKARTVGDNLTRREARKLDRVVLKNLNRRLKKWRRREKLEAVKKRLKEAFRALKKSQ